MDREVYPAKLRYFTFDPGGLSTMKWRPTGDPGSESFRDPRGDPSSNIRKKPTGS